MPRRHVLNSNPSPRVFYGSDNHGGAPLGNSGNPHPVGQASYVPESVPINPGSNTLVPQKLLARQCDNRHLFDLDEQTTPPITEFAKQVIDAVQPIDAHEQYTRLTKGVAEADLGKMYVGVSHLEHLPHTTDPFARERDADDQNPHYYCFRSHPTEAKVFIDPYGTCFKARLPRNLVDHTSIVIVTDAVDGVNQKGNHVPIDGKHAIQISHRRIVRSKPGKPTPMNAGFPFEALGLDAENNELTGALRIQVRRSPLRRSTRPIHTHALSTHCSGGATV